MMLPLLSFAQSQSAKAILDKVSAKVLTCGTIKSNFSFVMENKSENIKEKQKGKMYLKGDKYKISLDNMVIYFDGEAMWTHVKETEEVNVTEPDDDDDGSLFLSPNRIFTFYKKGFTYKLTSKKPSRQVRKQGKHVYIDLIPTDDEKPFSKIQVVVDTKKLRFVSFKSFNKDGNLYQIKLTKYSENPKLPNKFYLFDKTKYPNVEINDLR